jgi:hypothetical protein
VWDYGTVSESEWANFLFALTGWLFLSPADTVFVETVMVETVSFRQNRRLMKVLERTLPGSLCSIIVNESLGELLREVEK